MEDKRGMITYWETRKINIGDYEGIEAGLSYCDSVTEINNKEKSVSISDRESAMVTKEEFDEAAKRVMGRVKRKLDQREAEIRTLTADYTDFDTEGKMEAQQLRTVRKKKKIKKKRPRSMGLEDVN